MQTLLQDLRYGARMLLKSKSFTALAVLSLALGIGANTAIFSLINATLLRGLPVAEPEQLVYVFSGNPGSPYSTTSYPDYVEFRDHNQVFEGLIAYGGITLSLNSNDQTDQIAGWIVSGNYFDVLGVPAALGRTFLPEENQTPGTHRVAVISHGLWQRRFGGDPDVIGQQMLLNGHSFTIIGVTPANFNGTEPETNRDVYVPMMMQAIARPPRSGYSGEMNPDLLATRGNRWLWMVGRLKPGVTPEQAEAAMNVIAQHQAQAFPNTNRNRIATLTPVSQGDPEQRGSVISVAGLLMSVVGITLLIACANVANLLLARASVRRKEIAVRLALGASRFRLMRQLLTESLLLAVLGGAVGLLLAWWTIDLLKAATPPPGVLPIRVDFNLDTSVLLFTLLLSLLTGIIFGSAPAFQASRPDLVPALKDESFAPDQRSRRFSLRNMLVVAQVALSLVLLISAGLFLRSLRQAQAVDPGFDAEKILTVPLSINLLRYTSTQGREFYRQVIERVEALPGVESASLARLVALSGGASTRSLLIEGQAGSDNTFRSEGGGAGDGSNSNSISVNIIGLKYFQTMGIALRHGRDFNRLDTEDKPGVVIINEAFAERYFAGQDPVGKRLSFRGTRGPWQEIVGVARDSKYRTLGEASTPFVYQPLGQNHETGVMLHVRAVGDPASLTAAVRSEVQTLEKNLPVTGARPMTELISSSLYAARMGAALLGIFGLLALLLASIGLYGVMSFSVAQRTHEIGIRMALGAQRTDVLRLVIREGMTLVAIGLLLGLVAASAVTRVLASFLYGISTTDAMTYASVPVMLGLVALLACYIPARRATKVDPGVALRYE